MLGTWVSLVAQLVKDPPANTGGVRQADSTLGQEDPLEKEMTTCSSTPGKLHSRAWWAMVHRVAKSRTPHYILHYTTHKM